MENEMNFLRGEEMWKEYLEWKSMRWSLAKWPNAKTGNCVGAKNDWLHDEKMPDEDLGAVIGCHCFYN